MLHLYLDASEHGPSRKAVKGPSRSGLGEYDPCESLSAHATPTEIGINFLVRVEISGFLKQDFFCLRVLWIRNATVVDWAHRRTLRFVKMSHAFGAAIIGNDINRVAFAISFRYTIPLVLGIASDFKDSFVGTFRETGAAVNALFGNLN